MLWLVVWSFSLSNGLVKLFSSLSMSATSPTYLPLFSFIMTVTSRFITRVFSHANIFRKRINWMELSICTWKMRILYSWSFIYLVLTIFGIISFFIKVYSRIYIFQILFGCVSIDKMQVSFKSSVETHFGMSLSI